MTQHQDDLFSQFLAEFDPNGDIQPWLSETQLHEHFLLWQKERSSKPKDEDTDTYSHTYAPEKESRTRQQDTSFTVNCLSCSTPIRLAYPFKSMLFRCRRCRAQYSISSVHSSPLVFVITPVGSNQAQTSSKRSVIPPEVRQALGVLGVQGDDIDFSQVREQFRIRMKEYHPDRVAHLGEDLRRLAEERTKAFISAYKTTEAYFESS